MADPLPSPDSKEVVDESLKQRLKKQPRRQEMEAPITSRDTSGHEEDQGLELRGQTMRGDH